MIDALRTAVATSAIQDSFTFEFGEVVEELQGAPGGSMRVAVATRLAGQIFAQFHLDLSRGDALFGEPDMLEGSDLLAFAKIPRVHFPVYPVAQHLAEKLHAYSVPRHHVNTRVKDLVDMVAIAAIDHVAADALTASIADAIGPVGGNPRRSHRAQVAARAASMTGMATPTAVVVRPTRQGIELGPRRETAGDGLSTGARNLLRVGAVGRGVNDRASGSRGGDPVVRRLVRIG